MFITRESENKIINIVVTVLLISSSSFDGCTLIDATCGT